VRRRINVGRVVVVNVLLGWSVIGWIIALVMASGVFRLTLPLARVREKIPKVRNGPHEDVDGRAEESPEPTSCVVSRVIPTRSAYCQRMPVGDQRSDHNASAFRS
jgi:hypothetical protein